MLIEHNVASLLMNISPYISETELGTERPFYSSPQFRDNRSRATIATGMNLELDCSKFFIDHLRFDGIPPNHFENFIRKLIFQETVDEP